MLSDRSTKASKEIKDSSRERTALIYNRNKKEKREKLVLIKQIRIDYGKCLIECNRERKRCNNKKRRMEILRKSTYFHINDKYQYRLYSKNKPKFQKNCLQIILLAETNCLQIILLAAFFLSFAYRSAPSVKCVTAMELEKLKDNINVMN